MIYYLYNSTHLPNPDSWVRFQSLVWSTWFPSPYSSCLCDSWEEGTPLHQTPIKAHFNEGKLITALVTDAGWSASDANLCLCRPAGHNQSERKISERVRRGVQTLGDSLSWLKASGWLSVVYVLLLHRQASMLISPHSCCYTRTEEASPQWFMSCQGRGFASCLTSERVPLPWKGHIWAILATWGWSRWQDGILLWSHFHS